MTEPSSPPPQPVEGEPSTESGAHPQPDRPTQQGGAGWPALQPGQASPPASPQPGAGWSAPSAQPPGTGWSPPTQQPGVPGQPGQGWPAQPQHPGWPGQPPAGPPPQPAYPGGPVYPGGAAYPGGSAYPGGLGHSNAPGHPGGPVYPNAPAYPGGAGPAAVTAKRIPEGLPFVLRQSVGKRALLFVLMILFIGLVMACPLGAAVSAGSADWLVLLVIPAFMLLFALLLGFQLWLITSGGPVLAVGPDGLWVKTRPTRGQAIWLPWAAIDRIYLRRWALEKMLCVKPRDPRVGSGLGVYTALDSGLQQAFFGTGFAATVNFADRPEEEIMRAVVGYSAGRCRVG